MAKALSRYRNTRDVPISVKVGTTPGAPPAVYEAGPREEFIGPTAYADFFLREVGAVRLGDAAPSADKPEVEVLREKLAEMKAHLGRMADDAKSQAELDARRIKELEAELAALKAGGNAQTTEAPKPAEPSVEPALPVIGAPAETPKASKTAVKKGG